MVVKMFQQPQDPELLEGSGGVDSDQLDATLNGSIPEFSESGETCKALYSPTHNTAQEDISRHCDTEVQGQEEAGHEVVEPTNKRQVIDQHHEEPCGRTSLSRVSKSLGRKRTRSGNWTADETETLVKSKVQALRDEKTCVGRSGKSTTKKQMWEDISEGVSGRTSDQCRLRWDTLVKSYTRIKVYCECHKAEFCQLKEEFQSMKLATYFRDADWYKMIDENYPWRPMSGHLSPYLQGVSTSTVTLGEVGAPSVGSLSPNALPPVVATPASPVDKSEAALARIEADVEHGRNMELASSTTTMCWQSLSKRPELDSSETNSAVSNGKLHFLRKKRWSKLWLQPKSE